MTPSFVEWILDRLNALMPCGAESDPANKAPVPLQAQDTKPEVRPDSGNMP